MRTLVRQLKQTRFCWPFNNWRRSVIQPILTTTSIESRICTNLLQWPRSMGNSMRFKEVRTDWRSVPNKFENSQQTDGRNKVNYFQSLMRGDALQTFKNITSPNTEILGEILSVFRRKYVKLQSMATAKQIPTTGFQSRKPEVNWFSRRTPEISERCIRSCCSRDHRTIHLCQNASPPEEIN